jgi:hypothetical protein
VTFQPRGPARPMQYSTNAKCEEHNINVIPITFPSIGRPTTEPTDPLTIAPPTHAQQTNMIRFSTIHQSLTLRRAYRTYRHFGARTPRGPTNIDTSAHSCAFDTWACFFRHNSMKTARSRSKPCYGRGSSSALDMQTLSPSA